MRSVVICLKNRTFAVSQTSTIFSGKPYIRLWFAWKIVLLQYHKHLIQIRVIACICCDLLEKSYFCSITNIKAMRTKDHRGLWFAWKIVLLQYHKHPTRVLSYCIAVVICLKNRTFAVSQTSFVLVMLRLMLLWFAWKIVLLQYHKHRNRRSNRRSISCDLLEKSYFCSITNIINTPRIRFDSVVICLKNRTFAVSQTSEKQNEIEQALLWFAWKIVLLQYHKHLKQSEPNISECCDLLEKSYFCSITNILRTILYMKFRLWFAWKIVLLQYHKHLRIFPLYQLCSCDLLEKSYFCSITNIGYSLLSQHAQLWFAWKIVLLQYHKHLA